MKRFSTYLRTGVLLSIDAWTRIPFFFVYEKCIHSEYPLISDTPDCNRISDCKTNKQHTNIFGGLELGPRLNPWWADDKYQYIRWYLFSDWHGFNYEFNMAFNSNPQKIFIHIYICRDLFILSFCIILLIILNLDIRM